MIIRNDEWINIYRRVMEGHLDPHVIEVTVLDNGHDVCFKDMTEPRVLWRFSLKHHYDLPSALLQHYDKWCDEYEEEPAYLELFGED